jgi:hypothetical protein
MRRAVVLANVAIALFISSIAHAAEPSKDQCIDANENAQRARRSNALHDARTSLALCVSTSCPGPVREDCETLLRAVDADMPSIVIEARDARGTAITWAHVTLDGEALTDHIDGKPIEIDPGSHTLVVAARGLPTTTKSFTAEAGAKGRAVRIDLVTKTDNTQRTLGLVSLAAGGVAALVGLYFGMESKSTYDGALSHCAGPSVCDAQGVADGQTAHREASTSTIAFVVGGLLAAGGAALYLTAPKDGGVSVAPSVGTSSAGFRLGGSF